MGCMESIPRVESIPSGYKVYMASNPHVPLNIESEEFKLLECFCVIIYDKTNSLEYVNEARRELLCQKNRTMETIPPTLDAFLQHCRRASYQAGIWSTSDRAHQELPSPDGYGWTLNTERKWSPVWTTLPLASKACTELVRCGCKSDRLWGKMCM